MVDILDLPLDEEHQDEQLVNALSSRNMQNLVSEAVSRKNSAFLDVYFQRKEEYKDDDIISQIQHEISMADESILKPSQEDRKTPISNQEQNLTTSEDLIKDTYTDIFNSTVETLKSIIKIETDNIDDCKSFIGLKNKKKSKSGIAPERMTPSQRHEYLALKSQYREKVSLLLDIRSRFSKKLMADILITTNNTQEDVIPDGNDWTSTYTVKDAEDVHEKKRWKC